MSALNAADIFAAAEASVPDRSEVFGAVLLRFEATLTSHLPFRAQLQLYIISALCAVQLLLVLSSLALRFAAGDRWLFRTVRTRFGTYITPNFATAWQCSIVLFLVGIQVNVLLFARISDNAPSGFYFAEYVPWVAFLWAALLPAWSIGVSQCEINSRASGSHPKLWQRPLVVHAIFIGYPLIELISTLVLSAILNSRFTPMLNGLLASAESLAVAAQSASGLSATQLDSAIAVQTAKLQDGFDALNSFFWAFKVAGYFTLTHDLFSWFVYLLVAVPYLVRLKAQLREPAETSTATGIAKSKEFHSALYTAIFTSTILSAACLGYAILQVYQITLAKSSTNFTPLYADSLALEWVFAALGLPLCSGALWRSIELYRARRATTTTRPTTTHSNSNSSHSRSRSGSKISHGLGKVITPSSPRDQNRFVVTIERVVEVEDEFGAVELMKMDDAHSSEPGQSVV